MDLHSLRPPLDRLARRGSAHETRRWREYDPDYVREFTLTLADVPDLLDLARQWLDAENLPEEEHLWSAPIHAWRSLAQLEAIEAVHPLLDMQAKLDARNDDWYVEEFHDVFAMIGPFAIPALADYFSDHARPEFARVSAANGLCEIAKRHVGSRVRVVEILTAELGARVERQYCLNGLLVAYLLDLQAVESAEVIERAFAANVVDEMVTGDWQDARQALGVKELGLVPDRPRASPLAVFDRLDPGDAPRFDSPHRVRQKLNAKKAKAKRKQQQQSRRRNRRAK